jgi:hypothetical protein
MTFLKINRLIVTKYGKRAYDEKFHSGVNIIRGDNGSGKSTISNFIYYILGGDFISWLPEARGCDSVYAEVQINERIATLKREVTDQSMRPMDIFMGGVEEAIKNSIDGWQRFGYSRGDTKNSFSQVLFDLLNFPEISTDNGDNITINQVLRLLYIDQLTPINALVKTVDFDSPLIRRAVSYLLLGAYNDTQLRNEQKLKANKKLLTDLQKEEKIYSMVLKSSGYPLDLDKLNKQIEENEKQLDKINLGLEDTKKLRKNSNVDVVNRAILDKKAELEKLRRQAVQEQTKIKQIEINIIDSKDFIDDLKKQLEALKTSLVSRSVLGELPLAYCPSCLSHLESVTEDHLCGLCKQDISVDKNQRVLNMQQELSNQIKESELLLIKKTAESQNATITLEGFKDSLKIQQKEFENSLASIDTTYDKRIEELLIKKGRLLNINENILKHKELLNRVINLQKNIDSLLLENNKLEKEIESGNNELNKKLNLAFQKIQEYTLLLLKEDGNYAEEIDSLSVEEKEITTPETLVTEKSEISFYEEAFKNGAKVSIDFFNNSFSLDNRSNFSASSLVILKNSIRFGIFFASIELDFFRYPRFILCDNIEDKGMNPKRSKNFQESIVKLANRFTGKDFQMIFTTSMVNETLDNEAFTIGNFYTSNNKSLK